MPLLGGRYRFKDQKEYTQAWVYLFKTQGGQHVLAKPMAGRITSDIFKIVDGETFNDMLPADYPWPALRAQRLAGAHNSRIKVPTSPKGRK